MLETANEYMARSQQMWREAQAALEEGTHIQASEKLWLTAAQAVKAVAEVKGWSHRSHRELYNVVNRLEQETGQRRLGQLFAIASGLHQNSYEWWMSLDQVRRRAADIQELREALFQLLETPSG